MHLKTKLKTIKSWWKRKWCGYHTFETISLSGQTEWEYCYLYAPGDPLINPPKFLQFRVLTYKIKCSKCSLVDLDKITEYREPIETHPEDS